MNIYRHKKKSLQGSSVFVISVISYNMYNVYIKYLCSPSGALPDGSVAHHPTRTRLQF